VGPLLSLFIVFISCDADKKIGKYFGRPDLPECFANGDGTAMCYGKEGMYSIEYTMNYSMLSIDDTIRAKEYCQDKEYRLYVCLKYPSKCK